MFKIAKYTIILLFVAAITYIVLWTPFDHTNSNKQNATIDPSINATPYCLAIKKTVLYDEPDIKSRVVSNIEANEYVKFIREDKIYFYTCRINGEEVFILKGHCECPVYIND